MPKTLDPIAVRLDAIFDRGRAIERTPHKVCEEAGVAWTTIWRYRNGKSRFLNPLTLDKLEDAVKRLEKIYRRRRRAA